MEYDVVYQGNDVANSYKEGIPTAEGCRTYCDNDFDAPFFSWVNRGYCYCKTSSAGRASRFIYGPNGDISGVARGCSGVSEYSGTSKDSHMESFKLSYQ